MTTLKAQKILLITGLSLLILQIPWFFVIQAIVNRTEVRTTATVIKMGQRPSYCRSRDFLCDPSPSDFPIYEYYDKTGKRYERDDMYLGAYKQHNPFRKLFLKEVGDTATAYYTKGKASEVVFITGPAAVTAWLIPLYLSIPVFLAWGVVAFLNKRRKQLNDPRY